MSKPIIHDLDNKQVEKEFVIIGGVKIDISFVPCGLTLVFLRAYDDYVKYCIDNEANIKDNPIIAGEIAQKQIELVSVFTKYFDEKIDADYISKNLQLSQLQFLLSKFQEAAMQGIKTSDSGSKKK